MYESRTCRCETQLAFDPELRPVGGVNSVTFDTELRPVHEAPRRYRGKKKHGGGEDKLRNLLDFPVTKQPDVPVLSLHVGIDGGNSCGAPLTLDAAAVAARRCCRTACATEAIIRAFLKHHCWHDDDRGLDDSHDQREKCGAKAWPAQQSFIIIIKYYYISEVFSYTLKRKIKVHTHVVCDVVRTLRRLQPSAEMSCCTPQHRIASTPPERATLRRP